jgi:CRISPR-associated endonuclease/helicase Cas3
MISYDDYFRIATGPGDRAPFPYQRRLALSNEWPVMLDVPTGLGKTEAIVLAWLYRRQVDSQRTPRRLVYMLPQRTLLEQTVRRTQRLLESLRARSLSMGRASRLLAGRR